MSSLKCIKEIEKFLLELGTNNFSFTQLWVPCGELQFWENAAFFKMIFFMLNIVEYVSRENVDGRLHK